MAELHPSLKMQGETVTRHLSHASEPVDDGPAVDKNSATLTANARDATDYEHQITIKHALRHYKKAIFWSLIVSMTIVMESYDTLLIGSFYAYPTFQEKFGKKYEDGYQISASWQAALSNGEQVGLFIGCLMNGYLADKFGRKRVIQGSLIYLIGALFMMFFAPNLPVLLGSLLVRGIPMGIFAIMAPTYAAEVCPVVLRSYLTGWVNICWVLGHIVASGVLDGLVNMKSEWGYRIPIAIQWVWPLPLITFILWCPESPWWLVRQGRHEDAKRALKALCSKQEQAHIDQTLAMMIHTNAFEQQVETGGGWLDCFRGANLRRTEISVCGWALQSIAGFAISGQATYFFVQAGLATTDAYKLTLGLYFVALAGNLSCYVFLHYFGRRVVYITGYVICSITMFTIAFLGLAPPHNTGVSWAQGVLLLVWYYFYSAGLGPTAISIASETPAARLRAKTVALARDAFYILVIINNVATPYLINPTAANLKGKAAFIPAVLCIIAATWSYFRLPECKGRTYEELDILFERNVPARKFKDYQIEIGETSSEGTNIVPKDNNGE